MKWFSRFFSKEKKNKEKKRSLGDILDAVSPIKELSAESEEKMIDWAATQIKKYGMQTPSIIFLESSKPLSFLGGQMGLMVLAPFLESLDFKAAGMDGYNWSSFFSKKENIERLIRKLDDSDQ